MCSHTLEVEFDSQPYIYESVHADPYQLDIYGTHLRTQTIQYMIFLNTLINFDIFRRDCATIEFDIL